MMEELKTKLLEYPDNTVFVGTHHGVAIVKRDNALYSCSSQDNLHNIIYIEHQPVCQVVFERINESAYMYPKLEVLDKALTIVFPDVIVHNEYYNYQVVLPLPEFDLLASLAAHLPRHWGDYPN